MYITNHRPAINTQCTDYVTAIKIKCTDYGILTAMHQYKLHRLCILLTTDQQSIQNALTDAAIKIKYTDYGY